MRPALAPTMRMTQDGDPEVRPYNVVFRYFSCPARSVVIVQWEFADRLPDEPMKEIIFADFLEISSHPSFSCRITPDSPMWVNAGSIGEPSGLNPRI